MVRRATEETTEPRGTWDPLDHLVTMEDVVRGELKVPSVNQDLMDQQGLQVSQELPDPLDRLEPLERKANGDLLDPRERRENQVPLALQVKLDFLVRRDPRAALVLLDSPETPENLVYRD